MNLQKINPEYLIGINNPFNPEDETFLFLGEIENMKGHGTWIGLQSKEIYIGYHLEDFIELTEDET